MAAMDFPVPTYIGQQYSNGTTTYQWDGVTWNIVPQPGPMWIGDSPPANPAIGQQWFRTTNCCLYVWYNDGTSSQWVQSQGSNAAPGIWEPIYNGPLVVSNLAPQLIKDIGPYERIRFSWNGKASAGPVALGLQFSQDNGVTFFNTTSDYIITEIYMVQLPSTSVTGGAVGSSYTLVSSLVGTVYGANGRMEISGFNKAEYKNINGVTSGNTAAQGNAIDNPCGLCMQAVVCNAMRFLVTAASTITGRLTMEGVRG